MVATVTDDARLFEVPKLRVCALKFTETARARIVKVSSVAGWQRITATAAAAAALGGAPCYSSCCVSSRQIACHVWEGRNTHLRAHRAAPAWRKHSSCSTTGAAAGVSRQAHSWAARAGAQRFRNARGVAVCPSSTSCHHCAGQLLVQACAAVASSSAGSAGLCWSSLRISCHGSPQHPHHSLSNQTVLKQQQR